MNQTAVRSSEMHPLARCFVDGTSYLREMVGDGDGEFAFHLWASMEDTPYSEGLVPFAGWYSKEDRDCARGRYTYAHNTRQ